MRPVLIDTDTLSAVLKGAPPALAAARRYLKEHGCFTLSVITQYEVLRGLRAKNANKQALRFAALCQKSQVLSLDEAAAARAAAMYAGLKASGKLIGDADILIAATAVTQGFGVATANTKHFVRIPGLHVENWLNP